MTFCVKVQSPLAAVPLARHIRCFPPEHPTRPGRGREGRRLKPWPEAPRGWRGMGAVIPTQNPSAAAQGGYTLGEFAAGRPDRTPGEIRRGRPNYAAFDPAPWMMTLAVLAASCSVFDDRWAYSHNRPQPADQAFMGYVSNRLSTDSQISVTTGKSVPNSAGGRSCKPTLICVSHPRQSDPFP